MVDTRRLLIQPLRAATALTSLVFRNNYASTKKPASFLLLIIDRIDDLVAGKPALCAFRASQEMLLKAEEGGFSALRARHPHVEFVFNIQDDSAYRHWFY